MGPGMLDEVRKVVIAVLLLLLAAAVGVGWWAGQ